MNTTTNHEVSVGDIFCGTYGFEACIAKFMKVVAVKNTMVHLIELGQVHTGNWFAGTATPTDATVGDVIVKKMQKRPDENVFIRFDTYLRMYKWNGKPVDTYNHH